MLTVISLIIIGLCLIIILAVIIKKFPALAILDIENLPGEKEAKFKDQIIKARVERDLARWSGAIAKVWLSITKRLDGFLHSAQKQLRKIRLNYKASVRIPWPEKKKRLQELFAAVSDLSRKGKHDEAEEKLLEIISLDNKNVRAFFELGNLYGEEKKYPEARQTYEYVLKLARQFRNDEAIMGELTLPEIHFSLAGVLEAVGELETACENLREALDLEPNNPRYLDLILDLSIMKKDKEEASRYFEKLAAVNPENQKLADWKEKIDSLQ